MEIIIIADNRELNSGIPDLLEASGVHVVMQQLVAGDYMIHDEIVIERKTKEDFVQSIINGQLFGQCAKLKRTGAVPLIIVEGNPYRTLHDISTEAVKGALLSVSISWQIPVIRSSGPEDTARLLMMAASKQENPPVFIRRKGIKPKKLQRQQHYILQGLPGVGPALAYRLLHHFKTIERIVLADVKSLEQIEGIGKNKAEAIFNFFRKTI